MKIPLQPIDMNVNTILKDMTVTVRVKGMKSFRFRLFIAALFFKLGAFILRCPIIVEEGEKTIKITP
jgi:hypothetical protein